MCILAPVLIDKHKLNLTGCEYLIRLIIEYENGELALARDLVAHRKVKECLRSVIPDRLFCCGNYGKGLALRILDTAAGQDIVERRKKKAFFCLAKWRIVDLHSGGLCNSQYFLHRIKHTLAPAKGLLYPCHR